MNSEFEYISHLMLDVKRQAIIQNKNKSEGLKPDSYIPETVMEWNRCAGCGIPGPDDHPNPDPPPVV